MVLDFLRQSTSGHRLPLPSPPESGGVRGGLNKRSFIPRVSAFAPYHIPLFASTKVQLFFEFFKSFSFLSPFYLKHALCILLIFNEIPFLCYALIDYLLRECLAYFMPMPCAI